MTFSPDSVVVVPLAPPKLTPTNSIDQKVKVGGIAGLLALGIMTVAGHFGFNPQPAADWVFGPGIIDVQSYVTYFITIGVAYIVPMAWQDIAKRLNNKVIAHAVVDETVSAPVTLAGIAHEVTKIETGVAPV